MGIVIPAIALSVSAYWSLVLHWPACVMCWSERMLLGATLLGWAIDNLWVVALAPAVGSIVASVQWWIQLRAAHVGFCSATASCDVSYLQWGPFTTAALAALVFMVLLLLAMDRIVHRPAPSNLVPFPRKAS